MFTRDVRLVQESKVGGERQSGLSLPLRALHDVILNTLASSQWDQRGHGAANLQALYQDLQRPGGYICLKT